MGGVQTSSALTSHAEMDLPVVGSVGTGTSTADFVKHKSIDGAGNAKNETGAGDAGAPATSNGQTVQNLQASSSKTDTGIVPSKIAENGAAQTTLQPLLTPTGSHESATAQRATSGAPDPARVGRAADPPASAHLTTIEGTPAYGINSAKLIQTMGDTEMHVGMHSAEFGDISIRTLLNQQQMVAQISLDHSDLSHAIASHLSTVQAKLGEEYGLHASIEINNQGSPLSSGQGNSQQRDQQSPGHSDSGASVEAVELSESGSNVVAQTSAGSGHGLDITV